MLSDDSCQMLTKSLNSEHWLEIILIEKFLMAIGKPIKVIPKHKKTLLKELPEFRKKENTNPK
jgi:hypothetical protein